MIIHRASSETTLRNQSITLFKILQKSIADALEASDAQGRFTASSWERPDESASYGGGGISLLLEQGRIFEQAGVNFSAVEGTLPAEMVERLTGQREAAPFFATGVSLVVHPISPHIPTTHANVRYLEVGARAWFGGGLDLTPFLLYDEDATHFHQVLKSTCDRHDPEAYLKYKKWCDDYFYLPHRGETRGIGGLFFDYLGREGNPEPSTFLPFVREIGESFVECYLPLVERRAATPWTNEEKTFQLHRRGRYIEFNLLYDRGTLFGLKTGGRVSSIFMSFPPQACWKPYEEVPAHPRARSLLEVVRGEPRSWA